MPPVRALVTFDLKGLTPESWCCVDCGINTFPGCPTRIEMERVYNGRVLRSSEPSFDLQLNGHCEVYNARDSVWQASGMEPMGGCLCIACLERHIGRKLTRSPAMSSTRCREPSDSCSVEAICDVP